jgi:hypothetical protein
MTTMIQGLSTDFQAELKAKQDALDVTQAHLRAATRELAEQRKQITAWQGRCGELDQITQRIRNVEKALTDEDQFDWTGRTDLNGNDARDSAGVAFQRRGSNSTMVGIGGSVDISFSVDVEPPIPTNDSAPSMIRLRRLKMWHLRMEDLMKTRLKGLQGASAEKEYQCKKIVALCTGISIDKVEDVSLPFLQDLQMFTSWSRCWKTSLLLWKARPKSWTSAVCLDLCRRCVRFYVLVLLLRQV